jgi:hypothetical protein
MAALRPRRSVHANLLSDAAAAAAAAAAGALPRGPVPTKLIAGKQADALRAALDAAAVGRPGGGGAWSDEELTAVGAAVHAAVPERGAPGAALVRAWMAKHWRAPGSKPKATRLGREQKRLLLEAVAAGTSDGAGDEALRPLLEAVNAAGANKKLAPAELRERLRALQPARRKEEEEEEEAAELEGEVQAQQEEPDAAGPKRTLTLAQRVQAVRDAITGARRACAACGVRRAAARAPWRAPRALTAQAVCVRFACAAGAEDALKQLQQAPPVADAAGAGGAGWEEAPPAGVAGEEAEAHARELCGAARRAHAALLRDATALPPGEPREAALAALQAAGEPLARALRAAAALLPRDAGADAGAGAGADTHAAAEAAPAPATKKTRKRRRKAHEAPSADAVPAFRRKTLARVRAHGAWLAAWGGCAALLYHALPGEVPHGGGALTVHLPGGLQATEAETAAVMDAVRALLAGAAARGPVAAAALVPAAAQAGAGDDGAAGAGDEELRGGSSSDSE